METAKFKEIQNCNNDLLEQQKQELIYEIVHGNNKDYFKIFDIEAGCRKTRTAEQAIAEKVKTTNDNIIFVRLNNSDCKESANNINKLAGKNVAFDYNNVTVTKKDITRIHKELPDIRVLILTHAKYKHLAKDSSQRKIYSKGRNTLVIDEFVSDIEKLSISIEDIDKFKEFFVSNNIIYELYLSVIAKIEDTLNSDGSEKGFVILTKDYITKNISTINRLIKNNLTNEDINKANIVLSDGQTIKTIKQFSTHIKNIKEFYKKPCYVDSKTIYTTNSDSKNWMLDNNILLDASGILQTAYNLNNKLYRLQNCEKVLNHNKWKLHNIIVNTTSSGKTKIENFYDIINANIEKYGADSTLIVGSQEDITFIKCKHKAYFGNLTGSNEWADIENIIITQTANLTDVDYILQYLHYTTNTVLTTFAKASTKFTGRNMTARYSFTSNEFEKIRCTWIAEQTYQALKRVNRNMEYSTNAIIFMNNTDVIKLLKSQLVNCDVVASIDDSFKFKKSKQNQYIDDLQKDSHAKKFTDLLIELQNGEHKELLYQDKKGEIIQYTYAKKTIREYLKIKNANNFNMMVLSKTDVINFCRARGIQTTGQYIKLKENVS